MLYIERVHNPLAIDHLPVSFFCVTNGNGDYGFSSVDAEHPYSPVGGYNILKIGKNIPQLSFKPHDWDESISTLIVS